MNFKDDVEEDRLFCVTILLDFVAIEVICQISGYCSPQQSICYTGICFRNLAERMKLMADPPRIQLTVESRELHRMRRSIRKACFFQ
jgi:hypothetical protein